MGDSVSRLRTHICDDSITPLRFLPGSHEAHLLEDQSIASFPPYTNDMQMVAINCHANTTTDQHSACIHFKINCTGNTQVILGLGIVKEDNSRVFWGKMYANVTQGKVIADGRSTLTIAPCRNEGVIKCCLDMKHRVVHYSVHNPSILSSPVATLSLGNSNSAVPSNVSPMVGVLEGGDSQVKIKLLPLTQRQNQIPNSSQLLQQQPKVRFDNVTAFGPVHISSDGLTVKRGSDESNCCVAMNLVMREGVHRWTLKVIKDNGGSVCLGIAEHPLDICQSYENIYRKIYNHSGLYLWRSYKGLLYADGRQVNTNLEPLGWAHDKPVTVEFLLNFSSGELEIRRNGVSMGVAFSSIKGPVCPVVAFYAKYDKEVKIMDCRQGVEENVRIDRSLSAPAPPTPATPPNSSVVTSSLPNPMPKLSCGAYFDGPLAESCEVFISQDRCTLARPNDVPGNVYCLLNKQCCRPSVYKWSFLIERDEKASTCIGVTSEPVNVCGEDKPIYSSPSMVLCQSFEGRLYFRGEMLQEKQFDPFWYDNSKVEITLDLNVGVMQYSINEVDQGIAFSGLKGNFRPVVAFYGGGRKKISLLKFETIQSLSLRQISCSEGINDLSIA